ncbi:PCI domain-containing protein 2 [Sciurus carolinensis]|uniref:PCI domain-containing protein 2 n=1 Tax=Sciurus carolinensis TaxID=30640 RepID=A0AA41SRR5_SCICA|nr:PCI domain-containing protein 2 [Sciurus carolinensis]
MVHIMINQYLQQVYKAPDTRDGASCAELVSFRHLHVTNPRLQMTSPEEQCQQVLEPPHDEMFVARLRCTYAIGSHDFVEAYDCHTDQDQSHLPKKKTRLPVMYAVALDLRMFANNAYQQLVKKGKSKVGHMLEKAAELLMSCFHICASNTRTGIEDSKKWGMLFLVNQFLKIYFKVNKLRLYKLLIRAIHSSNLRDDYSPAQRVRHWQGRDLLHRCGIFLILEKLKSITYQNLFKKVYLWLRTYQLSLEAFLVDLKFMHVEDVDIDEAQCILANLTYTGPVKGYISHQHQKLVVSKQNLAPRPTCPHPQCAEQGALRPGERDCLHPTPCCASPQLESAKTSLPTLQPPNPCGHL